VKANAKSCGLPSVAPHDLRRTYARLCHQAGGELDQIQFSRVEGLQDKLLILLLSCFLHRISLVPSRIHDLSEL
jgi:hypothetical protein